MQKLFIAVVITILFIIALPLGIGYYLSPQDKLEKADMIVVISGGETKARLKEGVWLYKSGYAPKLLFSGAAREGDVSNALSMKRIAMRDDDVPEEDILIEEDSRDTTENAEFSTIYIKKEEAESIILTTSPYHQRRAYTNFREHLGEEFKIINWSAKDSTWRKFGWWRSRESIQLTVSELMKNIYTGAQ